MLERGSWHVHNIRGLHYGGFLRWGRWLLRDIHCYWHRTCVSDSQLQLWLRWLRTTNDDFGVLLFVSKAGYGYEVDALCWLSGSLRLLQ